MQEPQPDPVAPAPGDNEQESPGGRSSEREFSTFLPFSIFLVSIIVFMSWQLHVIWQQNASWKKQVAQRNKIVAQSRGIQAEVQRLASDLVDLAATDADARAIVEKFQIKRQEVIPPLPPAPPKPQP